MAGDRLLGVTTAAPARSIPAASFNITSGKWDGVPSSILNATLSLDEKNHTLRVLAFHHHPFFNATKFVSAACSDPAASLKRLTGLMLRRWRLRGWRCRCAGWRSNSAGASCRWVGRPGSLTTRMRSSGRRGKTTC